MNKYDAIIKELEKIQHAIKVLQSHIEIWEIEKTAFIRDDTKRRIIFRSLDAIQEALKNLPEDLLARYSDLPWMSMVNQSIEMLDQTMVEKQFELWDRIVNIIPKLSDVIEELLLSGELE
jgi:uncharacterized protein with HEPN domain